MVIITNDRSCLLSSYCLINTLLSPYTFWFVYFSKQSYEACAIINLIIIEEETKAQEAK